MKTYLFTARTNGKQTPGSIYAANMSAARATLEGEGYEDVEFLDEGTDEASQKASFAHLPAAEIDPAELARARRIDSLGAALLFSLRANAPILVPLLAWNLWSFVQGSPFGWGDWLGFGLTVLFLAEVVRRLIPSLLYQRLLLAQVWGRWDEMRRVGRWMKRYPAPAPLSPFMHDFYEAKALLGLGRAEEAFALYSKWRGHPDVSDVAFLSMQSSLFDQARRFPEKITCLQTIADLQPDSALPWIELAMTYARANLGAEAARTAIAEAEQREMSLLFKAGLEHARAIVELDAGALSAALVHLKRAADLYPAAGGTALSALSTADVQAFVAIALLRMGRRTEADALWQGAQPLMQLHNEQEVLDRYAAALADQPWTVVP